MSIVPDNKNNVVQPESLTGKDVGDFSKDVAKDVGKQTIVWVLASMLTKGIRDLISKTTKS